MQDFNSKIIVNSAFKITDLAKSLALGREEKYELKNVEGLFLTHVLSEGTTGLKVNDSVALIYEYHIKLKTNFIPYKFIKALDKKTKVHTLFEVVGISEFNYVMANKKVAENIVIGDYYQKSAEEEWNIPEGAKLKTLEDIYKNIFAYVVDLNLRDNESATELASRKKKILALESEILKLERKKNNEVQLNKKITLNEKMREIRKQIEGEIR